MRSSLDLVVEEEYPLFEGISGVHEADDFVTRFTGRDFKFYFGRSGRFVWSSWDETMKSLQGETVTYADTGYAESSLPTNYSFEGGEYGETVSHDSAQMGGAETQTYSGLEGVNPRVPIERSYSNPFRYLADFPDLYLPEAAEGENYLPVYLNVYSNGVLDELAGLEEGSSYDVKSSFERLSETTGLSKLELKQLVVDRAIDALLQDHPTLALSLEGLADEQVLMLASNPRDVVETEDELTWRAYEAEANNPLTLEHSSLEEPEGDPRSFGLTGAIDIEHRNRAYFSSPDINPLI